MINKTYLIPTVFGAPSGNVLVRSSSTTRAGGTTTGAVSAAGGRRQVDLLFRLHSNSSSMAKGCKSDSNQDEENKVHFYKTEKRQRYSLNLLTNPEARAEGAMVPLLLNSTYYFNRISYFK